MDQTLLHKLIAFRRQVHQFPEVSLKEYGTRTKIKSFLIGLGVKEGDIMQLNPTALVVDLHGALPAQGRDVCIAFRADMDALSMQQANFGLQYRSANKNAAHMCGHDGHVTCLLGFAALWIPKLAQIPQNKVIRLLFQPSEEGPVSGAALMIENGCLDGVTEVYGFHNWPTAPVGELWCKAGAVMSEATRLKITILGTGGHGSEPDQLKVSVIAAIGFYQQFMDYLTQLKQQLGNSFVCTLPVFKAGERYNVISEKTQIEGTIRSFEAGISQRISTKIIQLLQLIKLQGFEYQFEHECIAPLNYNSEKQADHVLRVAKRYFGQQNVGNGKLPFKASEDFSYFTQKRPGAFFFLSSAAKIPSPFLHNWNFDFNDKLIDTAARFWVQLAQDRISAE